MYGVGIRFISKALLCSFTGEFQENKVKLRDNHLCPIKYGDSITSCLQLKSLLGAFVYLRQVSITFTLSLCLPFRPSVRLSVPYITARLPLDEFLRNLILDTFIKICREDPNLFTIRRQFRTVYMKTNVFFIVAGDITLS